MREGVRNDPEGFLLCEWIHVDVSCKDRQKREVSLRGGNGEFSCRGAVSGPQTVGHSSLEQGCVGSAVTDLRVRSSSVVVKG